MLTCVIVANPNVGSSYQKMACVLAVPSAVQFWRCYSRYWYALAGQYCRIAVCAGTDFPVGAWIATSSERSSYIGTQMVVPSRSPRSKMFLARCTTWWKSRSRPGYHHWYRGVRGDLHLVWPESEARTLPQKLAGALGI